MINILESLERKRPRGVAIGIGSIREDASLRLKSSLKDVSVID